MIIIREAFEPFVLTLPYPTYSGLAYSFMHGHNVTRTPTIDEGAERALLTFEEVWEMSDGPFKGRIQMEIERLWGVQSVDDALQHFALENGCAEMLAKPDVITNEVFPLGCVLTIDFGKAGYIPGNTFSYIFTNPVIATEIFPEGNLNQFTAGLGTLYIHPTFFHQFDWHQATINTQTIDLRWS